MTKNVFKAVSNLTFIFRVKFRSFYTVHLKYIYSTYNQLWQYQLNKYPYPYRDILLFYVKIIYRNIHKGILTSIDKVC